MVYHFTPAAIIHQYRRRLLAGVLLMSFITSSVYFLLSPDTSLATTTVTWNSGEFSRGSSTGVVLNDSLTLPVSTSTSDTSPEDFALGNRWVNQTVSVQLTNEGGIVNSQLTKHPYTFDDTYAFSVTYDDVHNLIYYPVFSGSKGGLFVVDTKGTADFADDEVMRYSTSSAAALNGTYVREVEIDPVSDLIYVTVDTTTGVPTAGGLHVIDRKGTVTINDDEVVAIYRNNTSPALANNRVTHSFYYPPTGILYTGGFGGSGGGLTAIDTKGTASMLDDEFLFRYNTVSVPAIPHGSVFNTWIDEANGFLYISDGYGSSRGGVTVIDTKNTATTADDVLVITYDQTSTPALPVSGADDIILDKTTGLLYIVQLMRVSVIDTKQTDSPADDEFLTEYRTRGYVQDIFLKGDLLHIVTSSGINIVDTKGNTAPADDEYRPSVLSEGDRLVAPIPEDISGAVFLDGFSYLLSQGLYLYVPGVYTDTGLFVSNPQRIDSVPTTTITADATVAINQDVTVSYRTGSGPAVWRDDFDTLDSYAGDLYGYGNEIVWQTATATDGVLRLAGEPLDANYAYFGLESGLPADHFAAGSQVTLRYRVLDPVSDDLELGVCTDEYEQCWYQFYDVGTTTDWQSVSFVTLYPFNNVLVDLFTDNGAGFDDTILELDYLQITTPDAMGHWSTWTTCPEQTCVLPDLGAATYLQYKLDLNTTDTATTPTVHAVSYNGDYQTTGTYQSSPHTFSQFQGLGTFNADIDTNASTSIAFEYTLDEGTTWSPITPGADFPAGITTKHFSWRATLTTTDGRYTPAVNRVSITLKPPPARTNHWYSGRYQWSDCGFE